MNNQIVWVLTIYDEGTTEPTIFVYSNAVTVYVKAMIFDRPDNKIRVKKCTVYKNFL